MNFVFDNNWVAKLWETIQSAIGKKQDKITGRDGQVVGFRNGEPAAQDMEGFLSGAWPDGPYTFEVSSDGHLFAVYAGIDKQPEEV